MIDVFSGKIEFDDISLVFSPNLTIVEFESAGFEFRTVTKPPGSDGWSTYTFQASMAETRFNCVICFRWEKPHFMGLEPFADFQGKDWQDIDKDGQRITLNNWLLEATDRMPPYEFDWGTITCEQDLHSQLYGITIEFEAGRLDRLRRK